MKNLNLQTLFRIGGFIPVVILIIISIGLFYINFMKYQNAIDLNKRLELAQALDEVVARVGRERARTGIYYASKGHFPNSKENLFKQRKETNEAIRELKKVLAKYPELVNPEFQKIMALINKINKVRKGIDNFKLGFKDWFINYYTKMDGTIYNYEATMFDDKNTGSDDNIHLTHAITHSVEKLLMEKQNLRKAIENWGRQRGFMTYITTKNVPIEGEFYYYEFFDWYFTHYSLPLETLMQNPQIKAILTSKKYKKDLENYRELLHDAQAVSNIYREYGEFDGYPMDSQEAYDKFTAKINHVIKINRILSKEIVNQLTTIKENAFLFLMISIGLLLFSVLMFIIYIFIERNIKQNFVGLHGLVKELYPLANEGRDIPIPEPKNTEESYKIIELAVENALELSKKAQEAAKAKSLFLANMSHEIRTPLNGILGFLELLKTTDLNDEQIEYINTITTSANSLLEIINNILDISKIESDKVELELIPFKPINEFEDTIEIFGARAADKGINLAAYIDPNIPVSLKGDVLKIKEVLINLLSNAIKFTHEGYVTLTIKNEGTQDNKVKLYFEVADTGIGVSEEQKDKIFEAFSQADVSVTRKYGGTGLGLAISGRYIELMGGHIQIESELNKGTKFFFEISLEVLEAEETFKPGTFTKLKIALLDKESNIKQDYLKKYLKYAGIEPFYFKSVEELRDIVKNESLNAVTFVYETMQSSEFIEYLESINMNYTLISSLSNKPEIDNFNHKAIYIVWDPINPYKTFAMLEEIDNSRLNTYKKAIETISKKEQETDKFDLKVLVAEDNPINQKLIKITLEQMGINVVLSNNGLEAFNKYSISPEAYDLIFMDIQMPVMDGVEATHEILEFEQEEEIEHTPIIALTANALKGDRERFLAEGMDEYLTKPLKKEELVKILNHFAKDKMKKEILQHNDEDENSGTSSNTAVKSQPKPKPQPKRETKIEPQIQAEEEFEPTLDFEFEEEQAVKDINIIVASSNLLEKNILINYLESFGYNNIKKIDSIKELGKNIDLKKENLLFIDSNFVKGFDIAGVAGKIKQKVKNIQIVVLDKSNTTIKNANYVLNNINKQQLQQIL